MDYVDADEPLPNMRQSDTERRRNTVMGPLQKHPLQRWDKVKDKIMSSDIRGLDDKFYK